MVGVYWEFAPKSNGQQVPSHMTSDTVLRPCFMDPQRLGKARNEEVDTAEVPLTEKDTSNWAIEFSSNADEENAKRSMDTAQEDEVQHEDERQNMKSTVKRFAPWWVPHSKEHLFLTVLSLLESTNHISTLLYVTASYQRVVLQESSSTCSGGAHLKPILPADCPEDFLLGRLPSCNWELQDLAFCEAHYEYDVRLQFDQLHLGFLGVGFS